MLLRGPIEQHDAQLLVAHHDRVHRGADDARQPQLAFDQLVLDAHLRDHPVNGGRQVFEELGRPCGTKSRIPARNARIAAA